MLQPIETAKLRNWNRISPTLRNLPGIDAGPGKVWFVPHYWGNTSITFRTDLAPEYVGHPSWRSCSTRNTRAASACSKASTTPCPSSRA